MKKILALLLVLILLTGCTKDDKASVANTANVASIKIGAQTWTTKNLDVANYSDGTEIPQVTDPTEWAKLTTGAWCYYNNDSTNSTTYGKLYNWYAVAGIYDEASKTDVTQRKSLAPLGYHIPSDTEWTTLTDYLGGLAVAGGKMKETGTTHWLSPNQNATNSSGFTALPGGYRSSSNSYYNYIGANCSWWSSSEDVSHNAWYRTLNYTNGDGTRIYTSEKGGKSVRCVKD